MTRGQGPEPRYFEACKSAFWQEVFRYELEYLVQHLQGCREVLSVGCGPATIEAELVRHGFRVTGLDVSSEALSRAPDTVRTVLARAEEMPFPPDTFDAVIYVASLQFVADYARALEKTVPVLRPGGRLILMLLNPASKFFQKKQGEPGSYVAGIRHTDLKAMKNAAARYFSVRSEYFLGIEGDAISREADREHAALYVILGTR
ncbi:MULTISPECIES: class I SAM-dependent methyltransferase [Syntrophotalea]|jgi:ubiquinone/menaquinone biosynthesis C-methylase UbiE|uniref:Methyltransferase type 11 domain-containing protein n=1 Tax=Syntrophotalea acetylenica TaxID=29542 RepID=A0A1L3GG54_SYNAC|nr:class I SAM-dependent methyltransferase [Syntrophotalea acetylenica]APG24897.1 hypothetical protein A7E75_07590 [Syntrophotalea acetylenica]APG42962.1 hypothetical protein A6070_01550 [Syntrophotalea acetylenica]MDY0261276.1 class I SAM-dependent methyltransferase [Syntrophotalea acetylenica]